MFEFLKSKRHSELEEIVLSVESNASNNYKDAAQKSFAELKEKYEALSQAGRLSEKQKAYYQKLSLFRKLAYKIKSCFFVLIS